jgi:hypothetical protein
MLYRPPLDVGESLLPHIGENQGEIKNIFNRF